jgi:hypothetical protein
MEPNAALYNGSPVYWRELIAAADLTQRGAAELCGISARSMRDYLKRGRGPYSVQFCLECLAREACDPYNPTIRG